MLENEGRYRVLCGVMGLFGQQEVESEKPKSLRRHAGMRGLTGVDTLGASRCLARPRGGRRYLSERVLSLGPCLRSMG